MKPQVILVDDDKDICDLMQILLGDRCDCFTYTSPDQALQKLQADGCISFVTDYKMPSANGLDILKKAHDIHPESRKFLLTGAFLSTEDLAPISHIPFEVIEKPFKDPFATASRLLTPN